MMKQRRKTGFYILPQLLMLVSFLLACENKDRQTQVQAPEISPTADSAALTPEEVEVNVMAGGDTTIQNNSLMNSLIPQWTVREVLQKMPDAKISKKEPVPNRHINGQVDTLVTIRSDSTLFQFYSLPDKDMLQSATLNKGGLAFGGGLEIGMTADEVAQKIPGLQHKKALPQTILIRAEQSPTSLRLRFKKNRLAHMNYDGYVD